MFDDKWMTMGELLLFTKLSVSIPIAVVSTEAKRQTRKTFYKDQSPQLFPATCVLQGSGCWHSECARMPVLTQIPDKLEETFPVTFEGGHHHVGCWASWPWVHMLGCFFCVGSIQPGHG